MRDLLLFGSGGLARETLGAVAAVNEVAPTWRVLGIVDDNPSLHGGQVGGVPVLGGRTVLEDHPHAAVALCTGSPRDLVSRRRVPTELGIAPERWATVVHPSAQLGPRVELAPGVVLLASVVCTADVRIGPHVVVMPATVLTHDDELGAGVVVASGVRLSGAVRVGDGAYLGAGSVVREGVNVGREALVGMGAVVVADVPDGQVWAGNPARRLR